MTFARHLALRSATRSIRSRRLPQIVRRGLASEAAPESSATQEYDPTYPSLFAQAQEQNGQAENLMQAYYNKNTLLHTTAKLGSELEPHYKPNDVFVDPPLPSEINVEQLIASQTHFGHSTSLWHPANSRYIFGVREGIHIISSDITAAHLRRAGKIVSGVAERAGTILFVGTRRGQERMVVKAAQLAGACYQFDRWIPGTITNGQHILSKSTAKVVDEFDQEVEGFDSQLAELPVLKPDLIVCLNPLENYIMLHECGLANIPTIGIVDTDTNPTWVTYPIPANDDSLRSVALIALALGKAGQQGQQTRLQAAQQGRITYLPPVSLQRKQTDEEGQPKKGVEDESDASAGLEEPPRMGQGTNFFEAGMSPRGGGTVLDGSTVRQTGSDVPSAEEAASAETRATPGKGVSYASDRDFGANIDADTAASPMTRDPAGSQGTPAPGREMKKEDSALEEGSSQVR